MSTVTDRIGNLEIRDNSVAAHAERLPYEVYDLEHPNYNYPVLVATFANRVDAIQYAQIITGEGCDDDEPDFNDSMDGDHESALASAGWGTDEDYSNYCEQPEDW